MAPAPKPQHSTPQTDVELALVLGEMRGQLKELVHSIVNRQQRDDALGRTIAKLESLPDDVQEIKKDMAAMSSRLTAMELAHATTNAERKAERNLVTAFFSSPVVAWLVLIGGAAWAFLTGKIDVNG